MTAPTQWIHITPDGFSDDPWQHMRRVEADVIDPDTALSDTVLCLNGTSWIESLWPCLQHLKAVSISFPSFQDGRGFSLARKLRGLGYEGGLRAEGEIHVDQFRHALLAGFDAVAIPADLAARMPENEWIEAAAHALPSYQQRFLHN